MGDYSRKGIGQRFIDIDGWSPGFGDRVYEFMHEEVVRSSMSAGKTKFGRQ
jgi:hypothetical protein